MGKGGIYDGATITSYIRLKISVSSCLGLKKVIKINWLAACYSPSCRKKVFLVQSLGQVKVFKFGRNPVERKPKLDRNSTTKSLDSMISQL